MKQIHFTLHKTALSHDNTIHSIGIIHFISLQWQKNPTEGKNYFIYPSLGNRELLKQERPVPNMYYSTLKYTCTSSLTDYYDYYDIIIPEASAAVRDPFRMASLKVHFYESLIQFHLNKGFGGLDVWATQPLTSRPPAAFWVKMWEMFSNRHW